MRSIVFLVLVGCGGMAEYPASDASPDSAPDVAAEDSPGDTSPGDVKKCGWVCAPVDGGTTAYVDTCRDFVCPGTGNCAAKPVPNVCADGG